MFEAAHLAPLTDRQEDLLEELFSTFENSPHRSSTADLSPHSFEEEELALHRWFSRIASASERQIVIRMTQALAELNSDDN